MLDNLLSRTAVLDARHAIYRGKGYFVIKDFLSGEDLSSTTDFWTKDLGTSFAPFVKNTAVNTATPRYKYNRPTDADFAYCTHIWNEPIDERLHEYAILANMIRNQVMSKPIYFALHESTGQAMQYRVNRTVSSEQVVKKHADYFAEYRADPTGCHDFDPSRLELTIFLSEYGRDYDSGGFHLYNAGEHGVPLLFGRDNDVGAGDLVVWRYSIFHEVNNVNPLSDKGFLRVIIPTYDTKK